MSITITQEEHEVKKSILSYPKGMKEGILSMLILSFLSWQDIQKLN
jgi:hypothetical protein